MKTWFIVGCFVVVSVAWSVMRAQAPAVAGPEPTQPPASWLVKVNAAVNDMTPLELTAEEAAEMVATYTASLRQRPGDIAISDTTCYVLGVDGSVLMSQKLAP